MAASLLRNVFSKVPMIGRKDFFHTLSMKDEKFYQRVLRLYEKNPTITIERIEKTPACEKGSNFVSEVSRVNVFGHRVGVTNNDEYRNSVIVKELPSLEQRKLYRSCTAMENESKAYNKIISVLQKYSAGPLPVPDCIYADTGVIILQDLCLEGYKAVGKSAGGLTLEQCEIALEGLAKLHAASFVFKHTDPEKFKQFTKMTKELLYHGGDSLLLNYQTKFIENVLEIFKKLPVNVETEKTLKVVQDLRQHSRTTIKQLLLNPREHSVLCHGDIWAANILFNKMNELKLVDLQLMRYNSVASDLSYLMYVNLLPEVRINNTEKLLDIYLKSLHKNIKEKGVNLENVLTKSWLAKEMDVFAIYGVIFGMWVLPVFYIPKEDVEISKERLSDSSKIGKQTGSTYEERLKDLLLGYVRSLP